MTLLQLTGDETLTQLTEARSKLLTAIEEITSNPLGVYDADDSATEKRWKKGDKSGEFTQEQRDRLAALESELDQLDAKIDQKQVEVDRRNKQAALEKRAKSTDFRNVPDLKTGFSEKEHRDLDNFSLSRFIQLLSEGRSLDGIEGEMAIDGAAEAKASGIEVRARAFMVSGKALQSAERRDLSATGGTGGDKGGMTVETDKAGLLDSLFHGNPIAQAGGTVLTGLVGNLDVPRLIKGTSPAKKAETAAADEYDPTLAQAQFTPKRLPTFIEVSAQLMMQSNERALQAVLENHLMNELTDLIGKACINGDGTNEAEGILQTSGIGAVVGGTNGLAPNWSHIVELETDVANANALRGQVTYLTNSKVIGKLKETPKVASTDSVMILNDAPGAQLNGNPWLSSNAVPSDLDKGTSTGVCSAIIFGNFADFWLANWSGIEFLVNPYSKDSEGLVRINASVFYDGHVVRAESFSAMQDALTT